MLSVKVIFQMKKALRWSVALYIPVEVFTIGVEPLPINDYEHIIKEIEELRKDISDLRSDINDLNRRFEEHTDSHRVG